MAACPVPLTPLARRRPLVLTQRRLEANRRNARYSTGPRTAQGKARVARNAIKHGFFTAQQRWTPAQHRDFETLLEGLRDDLRPQDTLEDGCVRIMAESYVRMAAALRYESIAALNHHKKPIARSMSESRLRIRLKAPGCGRSVSASGVPACGRRPSLANGRRRRSRGTWGASTEPSRAPCRNSMGKNKPTIRQRREVAPRLCGRAPRSDARLLRPLRKCKN
jgi:hypothetical protein